MNNKTNLEKINNCKKNHLNEQLLGWGWITSMSKVHSVIQTPPLQPLHPLLFHFGAFCARFRQIFFFYRKGKWRFDRSPIDLICNLTVEDWSTLTLSARKKISEFRLYKLEEGEGCPPYTHKSHQYSLSHLSTQFRQDEFDTVELHKIKMAAPVKEILTKNCVSFRRFLGVQMQHTLANRCPLIQW